MPTSVLELASHIVTVPIAATTVIDVIAEYEIEEACYRIAHTDSFVKWTREGLFGRKHSQIIAIVTGSRVDTTIGSESTDVKVVASDTIKHF
jgi:hypothetical protein